MPSLKELYRFSFFSATTKLVRTTTATKLSSFADFVYHIVEVKKIMSPEMCKKITKQFPTNNHLYSTNTHAHTHTRTQTHIVIELNLENFWS